jgi:hypothetical protein
MPVLVLITCYLEQTFHLTIRRATELLEKPFNLLKEWISARWKGEGYLLVTLDASFVYQRKSRREDTYEPI